MTRDVRSPEIDTTLLRIICLLLLGGILTAGLWPFHSPKNQVSWLPEGKGLQFGHRGTIVSSGTFKAPPTSDDAPFTIEIWIEPAPYSASGTILAFHSREAARRFSLCQFFTGLDLQSRPQNGNPRTSTLKIYVHGIFHPGKPTFVTITSEKGQTSVYVEGVLTKQSASFPVSGRDLIGQLVVANSTRTGDSWSGTLRGLALFRRALTPTQVLHHYETWVKNDRPDTNDTDRAVAVYALSEREGSIVHNQISADTNLYIPSHFLVLDEYFLEPFWREYRPSRGYYEDVLVNIGGFIPLGFFFFAYFTIVGWVKKPALTTILLGFAVSMTIEVTQAWLPTRDSGMTDVITNTSGTALGVWLYRLLSGHDLFLKYWAYIAGRVRTRS